MNMQIRTRERIQRRMGEEEEEERRREEEVIEERIGYGSLVSA